VENALVARDGGGKRCSEPVLIHPLIPSLFPSLPTPQVSLLPLDSMWQGQYKHWGMAVDFQRWWPSDLRRAGRVRREGRREGGKEGRREGGGKGRKEGTKEKRKEKDPRV